MKSINLFQPYRPDSLSERHENRLTWAYLALLKYVPLVRTTFVDLLREKSRGSNVPIPSYTLLESNDFALETQRSNIDDQRKEIHQNTGNLFSVLITDEPRLNTDTATHRSSKAIYDGILTYGGDWVFVIENKPFHSSTSMASEQLSPFLEGENEFEVQPDVIKLLWRELVEPLHVLLEKNITDATSRLMIEDFLEYMLDEYEQLNPFDKFSRCSGREYLLNRRCTAIMKCVAGKDRVTYHKGFQNRVKLDWGAATDVFLGSHLGEQGQEVFLSIFPGNTVTQARNFFQNVDRNKFLGLEQSGWDVWKDLHFAFMAANQVWANSQLPVAEYFDYWKKNQTEIKQHKRSDGSFKKLFNQLEGLRFLSPQNLTELNEKFEMTQRQTINVCPGFGLHYRWPLDKAVQLDDSGQFELEFKARVNQVFATWGQQLPEGFIIEEAAHVSS